MPIPTKMADLSTLAASNSPAGSDPVGNSLDDYLRSHAAILRSTNAEASAPIVSASTTDIGAADGEAVTVSGSATITSLGVAPAGIRREVKFTGTPTLSNGSSIVLNGANIAVQAGDVHTFRSEGGGVWRLVASKRPIITSAMVTGALGYTPAAPLGYTPANVAGDTFLGEVIFNSNIRFPNYSFNRFNGGNSAGFFWGDFPTLGDGFHAGYNYVSTPGAGGTIINPLGGTSRISWRYSEIEMLVGGVGAVPALRAKVTLGGFEVVGSITSTGGVSAGGTVAASAVTATGGVSAGGVVSDVAGNVRNIPVIVRNSSAAFAATDRGHAVVKDDAGAHSWTVNTGVFDAGMAVTVINDSSSGNVTIVQGSGVTLLNGTATGNFTLAPGESRTLHGRSSTRVRVL